MLERKKQAMQNRLEKQWQRWTRKNVSMNDVAIAAGVSLKTVSRVINEPDSVRESTRDKVHSAMEALGFRTNFAARSPRWAVTVHRRRAVSLVGWCRGHD